jgi:site-specific recombinase XerD
MIATGSLPKADKLLSTFKDACERAGYTGNLVVHSLRHARNTRLRKAGVSKKIRKEMLGHISDEANEIYDHVDLEDQLEAVKGWRNMRGNGSRRIEMGSASH